MWLWCAVAIAGKAEDGAFVAGDPQGTTVIVQHSDYLCPHCSVALERLVALATATPGVRLELAPFPLTSRCNPLLATDHGDARCQLAMAAACGAEQGRYGAVVRALMANQASWDEPQPAEIVAVAADGTGVNVRRMATCLATDRMRAAVAAATAQAGQLEGTPTFDVSVAGGPLTRIAGDVDEVIRLVTPL
jgi:protein-disulfide isomerase